jgi:hypothetical protein
MISVLLPGSYGLCARPVGRGDSCALPGVVDPFHAQEAGLGLRELVHGTGHLEVTVIRLSSLHGDDGHVVGRLGSRSDGHGRHRRKCRYEMSLKFARRDVSSRAALQAKERLGTSGNRSGQITTGLPRDPAS